jgi:hypothetical protein
MKLGCSINSLTSVQFLSDLPYPEKLETLGIYDNNIQPTTLDFLRPFINLKDCKLGENISKDAEKLKLRLKKGTYNKFYGSLESIKNFVKLEEFCIAGTDVEEGLEYIPIKIVKLSTQAVREGKDTRKLNLIDCQPLRENAKVAKIQDQLRPFNYDLAAWQLAHFELVLAVNPENLWGLKPDLFTEKEKKEKLIAALITKIEETEKELTQLAADRTKERTRLEAKLTELQNTENQLQVELTQEKQDHQATQQNHTDQLNKILSILGITTGCLNLNSLSDNGALYNLVKEQAEASQKKIFQLEATLTSRQKQIAQVR